MLGEVLIIISVMVTAPTLLVWIAPCCALGSCTTLLIAISRWSTLHVCSLCTGEQTRSATKWNLGAVCWLCQSRNCLSKMTGYLPSWMDRQILLSPPSFAPVHKAASYQITFFRIFFVNHSLSIMLITRGCEEHLAAYGTAHKKTHLILLTSENQNVFVQRSALVQEESWALVAYVSRIPRARILKQREMFGMEDDLQPPKVKNVAGHLYVDRLNLTAGRCPF